MTHRIAHISDVHFGRIAHPEIVERLVQDVNAAAVDLVVVSGDLTQRAFPHQFNAARALLDSFTAPYLVVPGNHDVYAWWRPVMRLARPLRRYRKYISPDLMPRFEQEGLAVLGLNSAFGPTVKGGRIGKRGRMAIREFFGAQRDDVFKVLVVHHHLTKIHALGRHDVARNAKQALETITEMGVDLLLCGHLHISHIEPLEIVPARHRLVIASAGTATSSRGRKSNKNTNFYNLITIEANAFSIEERTFISGEQGFERACVTEFNR